MDTVASNQPAARDQAGAITRREEFLVFFIIAALIWPIVAAAIVGGYGFLVWMTQFVVGPPGPPQ